MKKSKIKKNLKSFTIFLGKLSWRTILLVFIFGLIGIGGFLFYVTNLQLPDLNSFNERKVSSSTKILDRTGEIVLYDVHENIQRIVVESNQISQHAKNAIIALEDESFYTHRGIDFQATARAIRDTIKQKIGISGIRTSGGSTITQQVIKNTLLTSDKKISRKLKEWILAIRLEQVLTKDEILTNYLNEVPYGGSIYGIEQASQSFFSKNAIDLTIAESAYLAAIPNAPTTYSPYGPNLDKLEERKNLALSKMFINNIITDEEFSTAKQEEVIWRSRSDRSSKALHFITYVRSYLESKYGIERILNDGLVVTTSLDYELQQTAERVALEKALQNEIDFDASNNAIVVIDPRSGEILTMVGSRDYNDPDIDGKFNVTIAKRQPGSSFKPFVYATAFSRGYTDETILFDVRTQFQQSCPPDQLNSNGDCYSPVNYDNIEKGPLTLRNALAQSRNIPAVKLLYLVGLNNSLKTARELGISTLGRADTYGLTLVLGGGEVTLLDMTSSYGVFANDGVRFAPQAILKIEDSKGNILEEYDPKGTQVIPENVARTITNILSDNEARTPLFGANSFLYFGNSTDVAAKTGTTNDNRDAWLVGYTPRVAVGVWSGNNDNSPMKKGSSISGGAWRAVMNEAIKLYGKENFTDPEPITSEKPFMRGIWLGGETYEIDTISGKLATEFTPPETRKEIIIPEVHSALHWINRNDPTGPPPTDPNKQSLYNHWELPVKRWIENNNIEFLNDSSLVKPTEFDDVHTSDAIKSATINQPNLNVAQNVNQSITFELSIDSDNNINSVEYYLNDTFLGSSDFSPFDYSFNPDDISDIKSSNSLRIIVIDEFYNRYIIEDQLKLDL